MTGIDDAAPVVGSTEIEIAATPEVAWEVLTGIDQWPSWNPAVKSASMDGPVCPGRKFRWRSGPGTISSTIEDVDPPRRIAWSGTSFGIKAIHVHLLEPSDGGTVVRTEESYEGLVARLFPGRLQKTLDETLQSGLAALKAEAERRAATLGDVRTPRAPEAGPARATLHG